MMYQTYATSIDSTAPNRVLEKETLQSWPVVIGCVPEAVVLN